MPRLPTGEASRRAILVVAISAIALETSLLGLIAPLLPDIEDRTGAGDAALGIALAAYAVPVVLISVPVGRLADRIGRRPLLLGGLVLTGCGSLLIAYSGSLEALIVGRAVQGVGSAASWIAALALVTDLARPGRKGEAIGFALAANSLGAVGGPALGGLLGGEISFEAPFLLVAGLATAMLVAGAVVLPRTKPTGEGGEASQIGTIAALRRPSAIVPAAMVVAGASFIGLIDFVLPLDLDRRFGTTATVIGLMFAAAAVLDAIASPLAGKAGDERGRRPVAMTGAVVVAIGGVLLAVTGFALGAAGSLIVYGLGSSILFTAAVPWLDDTFEEADRGLAYGGLNLVFAIGYTIGPLIGGGLLELASADVAYVLISVVATAGATWLALSTRSLVARSDSGSG